MSNGLGGFDNKATICLIFVKILLNSERNKIRDKNESAHDGH